MGISQPVINFIQGLKDLKSLYRDPLFSVCILRVLDKDTSALLFDLLRLNLDLNTIKALPNVKESLGTLLSLGLIRKIDSKISLDSEYRSSLLESFCLNHFDRKFKPISINDLKSINLKLECLDSGNANSKLEKIAEEKIHSILEYIASDSSINLAGVQDILFYCELKDTLQQITNKGFEFLLLARKDQLWFLIVNAIKYHSRDSLEESEMFISLAEILMKRRCGPYICSSFSSWHSFLDSIGVLFVISQDNNLVFYVNNSVLYDKVPLADSAMTHHGTAGIDDIYDIDYTKPNIPINKASNKFIVLETNFKIYAYTSTAYDKSVLSLFSKTVYVFPNLIKACFDEESLLSAFNKGITAKQIIKYLQEHSEEVPKNIVNQISIWEHRQHRIRARNGYLYHDFIHLSDFHRVLRYVESKGGLIYRDEVKRMIVGEERIHESVKNFIKEMQK
ncbi:uncharacterized protein VICG_01232 [Vittaforma corneae ATCC 50505]|uniref:RNA polymerase II transcription factor B subunit 2 n=1 Tax=Vittaforma corneae (strain ATCC 50505) TaxID=993615 RepID=L2GLG8_VITCO|nr:uncharacterized protein VICG_01232 [Vittaforma corneae ATCC 50505]ELA41728.1 hypothetical protein VICG_01232 [Vittaforma corneae ATCC 50505]